MAADNEYYHCEICGMVIHVLHGGSGTLECCSTEMVVVSEEEAKKFAAE
jgi:desulfoferrodoxin-like iron-binding protein